MKISIIFNINSDEKGVSINSAKSIYEILEYYKFVKEINILFFNHNFEFFLLDKKFMFSNTIEDFLYLYNEKDKIINYIDFLKDYDLVFLTTHGRLGEDGYIQKIFEENNIKYVGPSSFTAKSTFNKLQALEKIWENAICQSWLGELFLPDDSFSKIEKLLKDYKKLCIKPNNGGSSIGVFIVSNIEEAKNAIEFLKKNNYQPLIESYHTGIEFSITSIGNKVYDPIGIIKEGIFCYDKKYFPSNKVVYESPIDLPIKVINEIKCKAYDILDLFKSEYFLRIDGFYNTKTNSLIFTDFNSIPGFQNNGLFFKNKNHFQVMNDIFNIFVKKYKLRSLYSLKKNLFYLKDGRPNIFLIFGGDSSEQNVSILSGNNILFNLTKMDKYNIYNVLLFKNKFWFLSYEESFQTSINDFTQILKKNRSYSLYEFVNLIKKHKSKVFIGLHGGIGENGELQKTFEKNNISYTGSNSKISELCMNKNNTIKYLEEKIIDNQVLQHMYFNKYIFIKNFKKNSIEELKTIWIELMKDKKSNKVFIKPNDDGCSVGAMILESVEEFLNYWRNLNANNNIYKNIYLSQNSKDYLLCEYIDVDEIYINNSNNKIVYNKKSGWIEATIVYLDGKILKSSMTLSKNGFLTMEEKFLYGSGVNFTPIPSLIMEDYHNKIIEKVIGKVIEVIGITTYCRIDFFYNVIREQVNIIEVNTLPALTPSTVFFQQGAYFNKTPMNVINKILKNIL
jgi:D-alanine--D-alanine ligase